MKDLKQREARRQTPCKGPRRARRVGAVLVWCSFLLVLLLGMAGLVIDGALMMATHRQCQNAADAAALAAAMDLMLGHSLATAEASALTYVQDPNHNNLPDASLVLNVPPAEGGYAGVPNYVEAVVTTAVPTYFIQVLPGFTEGDVSARAVAGYEMVASGDGVMVLDPLEWPGLNVSGGGTIKVNGRVIVNSEGGGVDENGDPCDMALLGHNRWAAQAGQPNSPPELGIHATDLQIVGGVDRPELFHNFDPENPTSPLHCNSLPVPDPFANLPTPTVENGVDPTPWGELRITADGLMQGGDPSWEYVDPVTGDITVTVQPGVYGQIYITGSTVIFTPGIYVVAATQNNAITINGGDAEANGVMFYVTGHTYNPYDGTPDNTDPPDPLGQLPPSDVPGLFGDVTINTRSSFTPISTELYDYTGVSSDIEIFNGMLFYQRRASPAPVSIEGNAAEGYLAGTIYAKWAHFAISGQGTYGAQFVVGSIEVTGQGDVTLDYTGSDIGRAPQVFLVE